MASIHGKDGVVKVGTNNVAQLVGFEVTAEQGIADTTVCGADFETHLKGQKRITGTIDVRFDSADTNGQQAMNVGSSVALHLLPAGTGYDIKGNATITTVGATLSHTDIVARRFGFTGNGNWTNI